MPLPYRVVDRVAQSWRGAPKRPYLEGSIERGVALLVTLSAACVITCTAGSVPVESVSSAVKPRLDEPRRRPAPPAAPAPPQPAPPAAADAGARASSPLAPFHQALARLATGAAEDHVRILWFGDSHTAADFWPHEVRKALQQRFGDGGPGFVYLGLKVYRHGRVSFERDGPWRMLPRAPAFFKRQADGIYGLGGIKMVPKTVKSSISLEFREKIESRNVAWTLIYRLPAAGSRFTVKLSGAPPRVVDERAGELRASGLSSVTFQSSAEASLRIDSAVEEPELYGAILEHDKPGVVLDTLGINGARIATVAAWEPESWTHEVAARSPVLVILAFGTNEVGDSHQVWRYRDQYADVLGRLRAANSQLACLILGPSERVGGDWIMDPRVSEIEALQRQIAAEERCGFISVVASMGGPGTLKTWAHESPPLATKDGIHLTPSGYERIGQAIAEELLRDYEGP